MFIIRLIVGWVLFSYFCKVLLYIIKTMIAGKLKSTINQPFSSTSSVSTLIPCAACGLYLSIEEATQKSKQYYCPAHSVLN